MMTMATRLVGWFWIASICFQVSPAVSIAVSSNINAVFVSLDAAVTGVFSVV